jgi:naphthoate synthase
MSYVINDWPVKNTHFKQTDADVTSFDGGYGLAYLAKMVGKRSTRNLFLGRN